ADDFPRARTEIAALHSNVRELPTAQATALYLALTEERYDVVTVLADRLSSSGAVGQDARRRLLGALERFDQRRPNVAWTYYTAAELLLVEGRKDAARVFVDLFSLHCDEPSCGAYRTLLEAKLSQVTETRGESISPSP
ncbi:MAG: hypothetical protein Q7R41_13350, partial [Phycisphaerales bacterium]|nr:hypothetical protein [Phycisphaerales bacterium]